ncbi:MAG: STAS domain-containing protein [Ruminiclostridium sp.]|nr:STAS domain-containing protein [Ruminiclostridium sp.]
MELERYAGGTGLTAAFVGDVDSLNAAELEERLLKEIEGVTELTVDLKKLEYISSAGLHLLFKMHCLMKKQGSMVIINADDEVMELFVMTGFVRLLNIAVKE